MYDIFLYDTPCVVDIPDYFENLKAVKIEKQHQRKLARLQWKAQQRMLRSQQRKQIFYNFSIRAQIKQQERNSHDS